MCPPDPDSTLPLLGGKIAMKYLVLVLIVALMTIGKPTGIAAEPMTYDGVVTFDQASAGGATLVVTVHLQERPEMTLLALSIRQFYQSCGQAPACGSEAIFAGSQTQRILPADSTIERRLGWASLHTRITVFDTVSRTSVEVTIDVQWTATGALAPIPNGTGRSFFRDATAWGMITSQLLGTVPLKSDRPATISRHLGG